MTWFISYTFIIKNHDITLVRIDECLSSIHFMEIITELTTTIDYKTEKNTKYLSVLSGYESDKNLEISSKPKHVIQKIKNLAYEGDTSFINGIKYNIIPFGKYFKMTLYVIVKFDTVNSKCLGSKQFYADNINQVEKYLKFNILKNGNNGYLDINNKSVYFAYNTPSYIIDNDKVFHAIKQLTNNNIKPRVYIINY